MHAGWLVSDELRDLLGPDAFTALDNVDPASALTCQICGDVRAAGGAGPMAVIAAVSDTGTIVLAPAHPLCRDATGDLHPGLLDRAGRAEPEAHAAYASRPGPFPSALLIFESTIVASAVLPGNDSMDMTVALFGQRGFDVVTTDLVEVTPALAPGWSLDTRRGQIVLRHRDLGNVYTQDSDDSHDDWLAIARRQRRCVVVTGSNLGLIPGGPPPDLDWARRRGSLIAGCVAVR